MGLPRPFAAGGRRQGQVTRHAIHSQDRESAQEQNQPRLPVPVQIPAPDPTADWKASAASAKSPSVAFGFAKVVPGGYLRWAGHVPQARRRGTASDTFSGAHQVNAEEEVDEIIAGLEPAGAFEERNSLSESRLLMQFEPLLEERFELSTVGLWARVARHAHRHNATKPARQNDARPSAGKAIHRSPYRLSAPGAIKIRNRARASRVLERNCLLTQHEVQALA